MRINTLILGHMFKSISFILCYRKFGDRR